MYKGSNKTAITSQQMIADALFNMMEKQEFANISISSLCKEAQVSRQTFYSLFSSKENVVKFVFDNSYKFLKDEYKHMESFDLEIMCEKYCEYIVKNQDFFRTLIENNLSTVMYDSFKEPFYRCERLKVQDPYVTQELFASFISGALTSITTTFINQGIPDDMEYMKKSVSNLFNMKHFT